MTTLSGKTKASAGFTMVELLVVMGIIAMMAALTVGVVQTLTEGAKKDSARMLLEKVETSLSRYNEQVGKYPDAIPTALNIENAPDIDTAAQMLADANLAVTTQVLSGMDEFTAEGGTHSKELVEFPENSGDVYLVDPWYEGGDPRSHLVNFVKGGHNSPGLDIWCNGDDGVNDAINSYDQGDPKSWQNYGDDIVNWARR